jgi:outer membrane protein assembly factor BamB
VAVTLIDLDSPTRHKPGEAPVLRMGRALAGRRRREFLLAVMAVLALCIVGGSAVPPRSADPRMHPVGPGVPQARYAVGADLLFTTTEDGQSVAAYAMDSGKPVWRLDARGIVFLRVIAGVLVVGVSPVTRVSSGTTVEVFENHSEVIAVDERTGERRWGHRGAVAPGAESAAAIVVSSATDLTAYDPATGATVWQHQFGAYGTAPIADGRARLLVQEFATPKPRELYLPRHKLSSVDLATGAVTLVGSVDFTSAAILGLGEPVAVISAHTETEAERVTVQGSVPSQPGQVWNYAADPAVLRKSAWACGRRMCVSQGNLTMAFDAAAGVQVWRADAEWVNHQTMRVDGTDLLVAVRRGPTGPNTLLLDPETGQVRRDLANWLPLGAYRGRQLAVWTAASALGDSWLGYFDATAAGGVRPLFPLGPAHRCSTTARWLFCEAIGSGGQGAALPLDALGELPT